MSQELATHQAFVQGDLEGLKCALGNPQGFPNCHGSLCIGPILEYAIYHSPLSFIRTLLDHGADPNYSNHSGFPSLIASISCQERSDRLEILKLLLSFKANIHQRGLNDYTPLHYAAAANDVQAIQLLLSHGADPQARTSIDECATPLEEAEFLGKSDAVRVLRALEPSTS